MPDKSASPPEETTPTVREIEAAISDGVLPARRSGVKYQVAWNGDGDFIGAWRTPVHETQVADITFGDDEHEAAILVHEWLAEPENLENV